MHTKNLEKMTQFARCPDCGAVNDGSADECYLCSASPLLAACSVCGAGIRNPVHACCPACGVPYASGRSGATDRGAPGGVESLWRSQ